MRDDHRDPAADPAPTLDSSHATIASNLHADTGPAFDDLVGQTIGSYQLLGVLGRGGMGVVYEAEQQHPRRRVALKIIRGRHHADEFHVRMFHREAEMLGRLRHPGIAAIHESGHTEDGRHYFAMELASGQTLDRHVQSLDHHDVAGRLRIFLEICDAVGYAHQRGVIHRDLKPSNIVVQDRGVKVLDFGLARIMDPEDDDAVMLTRAGTVRGTPAYMSPEQADGDPGELDLRSDIYSLGVILYEMLAGELPLDVTRSTFLDALRMVRDQEPRPLRQVADHTRHLDSDLVTVVHKALDKDRDRRYQSVAELAQDVQRYLDHEPVLAAPPSTIHRLRKLVRRHRPLFAALAAVVVVLIGATIVSTTQYVAAERESVRARVEADKSAQIAGFMTDMLQGVGPAVARGRDTQLLREILDQTAARVGDELAAQPEVEATLRMVLGTTYRELGEHDAALAQLEVARGLRERLGGPDHPDALAAAVEIASVDYYAGRMAQAESLYVWAGDMLAATVGEQDQRTLAARSGQILAYTYQGKLDEAAALGEAVLPSLRQHQGDASEVTQSVMYHLAQTWADQLRLDEADSLYTELSAILGRELGPDHPRTLGARSSHGWLHRMAGRLDLAEQFTASALAGQRRVLGSDHNETLVSVNNLAVIYKDLGRLDEAEPLYLENLETGVRILGEAHPENLPAMVNLAAFYEAQERWEDVQRTADRAVVVFTDVMPDGHIGVALARMMRGLSHLELGRPAAAEADLLAAHAVMDGLFGSDHKHVRTVCTKLAESYDRLGRPGDAARWRKRAAGG